MVRGYDCPAPILKGEKIMKKHFITIGLAILLAVFGLTSCKFSHPGPQTVFGDHDSGGGSNGNNAGSNNGGNDSGNGNGHGNGNGNGNGHGSHGNGNGNGHGKGNGNGHASGYNGLIQLANFGEITGNNPSLFNYRAKSKAAKDSFKFKLEESIPESFDVPKQVSESKVDREKEVRDKLYEKMEKIGDVVSEFDRKVSVVGRKINNIVSKIDWENPTKERVILMILSSELYAVKMAVVSSFLHIENMPLVDVRYLSDTIDHSITLLNKFFWINIERSATNAQTHLDAYGSEELTKEFLDLFEKAGYAFGRCSSYLIKMKLESLPVLEYLSKGE